jgi:hypothetical protein
VNSAWGTGSCKTNYLLLFVAPATGKQIALPRTQISGLSVPPGKKSVDLERWVGGWALTRGTRKIGGVTRRKVEGGVNWVEDVLGGEAPTGRRRLASLTPRAAAG